MILLTLSGIILVYFIENIEAQKIFILLLSIIIFFKLKIKVPIFHPIIILFLVFMYFIYNRIWFDIFGVLNFNEGNFFDMSSVSQIVELESLKILSYTLLIWNYLYSNIFVSSLANELVEDKVIYKLSNFFFRVFVLIGIILIYKEMKDVLNNGYLSIYLSENRRTQIEKIILNLPIILYIINISSGKNRKTFYFNTILVLVFLGIDLLKGGRSYFVAFSLMLFYYYYTYIKIEKKIKFKLILFGLSLIFFSCIIGNFRSKEKLFNIDILDFLSSQTITGSILLKAIEHKDKLIGKIDILVPISLEVFKYNQSITKNFATRLSMLLNYELFESGFGLGGNPIAELYIYSSMYFFIIFFLFLLIIKKIIFSRKKNYRYMTLYLYFLPKLFLMPRNNLIFINILDLIKVIFVILVLEVFRIFSKRLRRA